MKISTRWRTVAKLWYNCYSHRRLGKLKRSIAKISSRRGSGQAKVSNNDAIIRSAKFARNSHIGANIIFAFRGPHKNSSRLPSQKRVAIITVRANNNFSPQFPPSSARVRWLKKKGKKKNGTKIGEKETISKILSLAGASMRSMAHRAKNVESIAPKYWRSCDFSCIIIALFWGIIMRLEF